MRTGLANEKDKTLTNAEISKSMLLFNLATGFGTICIMLTQAGQNIMTVFLKEWLQSPAKVIGFVVFLAGIVPIGQPLIAQIVQRIEHRKRFIITIYSLSYLSVFLIAIVPLLGRTELALRTGLIITVAAVLLITFGNQLVSLLMWTWQADVIPESRRAFFFGQGQSICNMMGVLGVFASSLAIDKLGGTQNPYVMCGIFVFAGLMGITAIYFLLQIPDMPVAKVQPPTITNVIKMIFEPLLNHRFRMLLIAIGCFAFSMSITHPYTILYARAAEISGHTPGLGVTLLYWSAISSLVGVVGIFSGPFWGWVGDRLGSKFIMASGSLALSWYWLFFITTPTNYHLILALGMVIFGFFFPAYNIGWSSCAFNISPRENKAAYMATIPFAMMLGGPGAMLGGFLADNYPVLGYTLPIGQPLAYIHLLTLLTTLGLCVACVLIFAIPLEKDRTLRELLSIVLDKNFLPNIVRAQILTYCRRPALAVWALNGINGASAQIAAKEIRDKLINPDSRVRNAALAAATRNAALTNGAASAQADMPEHLRALLAQIAAGKTERILDAAQMMGQMDSLPQRSELALAVAAALADGKQFYAMITREAVVPGTMILQTCRQLRKLARKMPDLKKHIEETEIQIASDYQAKKYGSMVAACGKLASCAVQSNPIYDGQLSVAVLERLQAISEQRPDPLSAMPETALALHLTLNLMKKRSQS